LAALGRLIDPPEAVPGTGQRSSSIGHARASRWAVADLDALRVPWALIGGLAVSVRVVPRLTKDLDFAVAVTNDPEAEDVVLRPRVARLSASRNT
jgi:hypothetical protein